jgi:hypothetical protein
MNALPFVLTELSSFGQYIYGIYLGFNGELLPDVRWIPDLHLLTCHPKLYLFLFEPSCCSPRCYPCLRAMSLPCLGSTSQNMF